MGGVSAAELSDRRAKVKEPKLTGLGNLKVRLWLKAKIDRIRKVQRR